MSNERAEYAGLHIRPLIETDETAWIELWDEYLTFYETVLPPEQTQLTWQRILDPQGSVEGRAAVIGGEVVGFIHYLFHPSTWSEYGYCYLEDLYVREGIRGGGVGRTLIEDALVHARAAKVSRVYWTTLRDNERARRLYDSMAELTDYVQYRVELDS